MSTIDYQKIKQLFLTATELDDSQREEFLARACADESRADEEALMTEVRSLLRSWSVAPDFLESPASIQPEHAGLGGPPSLASHTAAVKPALDLGRLLRHWDRYQLGECLGMGGQSLVYRTTDRLLGREVAIKFLVGYDQRAISRFQREARLLTRIRHPAVVQLHETGSVQGVRYLTLQLVRGPGLMAVSQEISVEQKVELIRGVAAGLQAAHDLGIVHRDIKPANILVERGPGGVPRPYLADFGIARDQNRAITATGVHIGTLSYLAPERLRDPGHTLDPREDIYALGVTFHELLTGCTPHGSTSTLETLLRIRDGKITSPRKEMPELPRRLEAILMRCLATDPEARYPSARALALDLERFLAQNQPKSPNATRRSLRNGRRAFTGLVSAGRAAMLVAGATALWFYFSGTGPALR